MRRRRSTKVTAATLCVVAGAFVILASCREATQVSIVARTNIAYRDGLMTAFAVGTSPASVESSVPAVQSRTAWGGDGFIGSLTVVPPAGDESSLAVKVVMGIRRDVKDCIAPKYEGCIIARRFLHYIDHAAITLPIKLWSQCEGVPCEQNTTCNALGECVSAFVDSTICDSDRGCNVTGDGRAIGVDADGSVSSSDAPAGDGPANDNDSASKKDGDNASDGSPNDAKSDADYFDAQLLDKKESGQQVPDGIECSVPGSPSLACSPGSICCNHSLTHVPINAPDYYCADPVAQPTCLAEANPVLLLFCDGNEDCPQNQQCCYAPGPPRFICEANCASAGHTEVCHSTNVCTLPSQTCSQMVISYRVCGP